MRAALLREVDEALKANRQRVKELGSSREAPTAPPRAEVPERWKPVERMIRAHASQAYIARENLPSVIAETVAALSAVEGVTDAHVAKLVADDPLDRSDGRVQLWPPISFARGLEIIVEAHLTVEAKAQDERPPWED